MRLFSWGARALFLGEALKLTAHRNAVAVLALGLEAPFELALNARYPDAGRARIRAALILPNTLHYLSATKGLMAFLYVDAVSTDLARLRKLSRTPGAFADLDLVCEAEMIARLRALAGGSTTWNETRTYLRSLLCAGDAPSRDARIDAALELLHSDPSSRPSLEALARRAGLSASRFIHLFKITTGVPLRRYKIWVAMGAAVRAIASGETLTTAALRAGFSSSAHFSATFRALFGMEPSRLSSGGLQLRRSTSTT
jgi:AraC-like DNA-binding protein